MQNKTLHLKYNLDGNTLIAEIEGVPSGIKVADFTVVTKNMVYDSRGNCNAIIKANVEDAMSTQHFTIAPTSLPSTSAQM